MKKYFFPCLIAFLVSGLFWVGVCMCIEHYNKPTKCKPKYINAINDGRFVVVPTDSAEGRPTFSIIFEDDSAIDNMYAEEIAASLISGRWHYNECAKLTGE